MKSIFLLFFIFVLVHADVLDLANFELRPNALGTELQKRTDELGNILEAKASVTMIMNNLNRPTSGGGIAVDGDACNKDAIAGMPAIGRSICFDKGDSTTSQWFPQGVTTVADMQADQQWGDGYQPILVSWYDHNKNAQGGNKGTRISFVDVKSGKYRHVLLVYPKRNSAGIPTYESLRASQNPSASDYNTALHAGGIVWYGNFLFVADTGRGFRMFDVRRIFDLGASEKGTTSGGDKIGLDGADGLYYGHGYRYIWPQIGSWTRTADTGTGEKPTCTNRDLSPQFSYVSLDRSGTDHLVAGEYCKKSMETNGRVFTYKIGDAFTNGELVTAQNFRWRAIEAYKLPVYRIQGATRFGGKWYLSQSNGNSTAGTLYITEPVSTTDTVLKVASNQTLSIGPEDLAHWPKGTASAPTLGNIWTVAEHTGSGDRGKRMLYSVKPNN